jgi:phospholipid transport system substrate-binding protein
MPFTRRTACKALVVAAALVVLPSSPTRPAAAAESAVTKTDASAVVESFDDVLLKAMKGGKAMGVKGRYDLLAPVVKKAFDLRVMIAIASGGAWFKASPVEQDKLADAFTRFTIATYASEFDSYDGQSFAITGVTQGPRGTEIVNTRLNQPNDAPVSISYVMRKNPSGAQIVDVLVDNGISQLAVRRSEYSSILAQKGVPGLVAVLDSKTGKLLGP